MGVNYMKAIISGENLIETDMSRLSISVEERPNYVIIRGYKSGRNKTSLGPVSPSDFTRVKSYYPDSIIVDFNGKPYL